MRRTTPKVLAVGITLPLTLAACGSGGGGGDTASGGAGSDYPTKPVTVIVPYSAGGSSDGTTRVHTEIMNGMVDGRFIVENRPGAGALIGTSEVAHTEPDGYKALLGTIGTMTTTLFSTPDATYSPEDFAGVAGIAEAPLILIAAKDTGWQSVEDVANSGPSQPKFGITGVGNSIHIAQAAMYQRAGKDGTPVPFDSNAETLRGILGGELASGAVELNIGLPAVEAGDVYPLAVTASERLPELPNVPTTSEIGNECAIGSSYAYLVPADTPKERIDAFRQAALDASETEEYQTYLEKSGLLPSDHPNGEEWMQFVAEQGEILKSCLEELNIETPAS